LSVCLCLEAAQAGAQRRPELTVPVCSQPAPTLDGRLDDACWAEAEPVVHFHVTGGGELGAGHRVTLVQRDGWLYAAFRVRQAPDRNPVTFPMHDGKLHREDYVQVALDPHPDSEYFYRFWVNRSNVRAESRFTRLKGWQIYWDIPWRSAVLEDKEGWAAELAIPLALVAVGRPLDNARGDLVVYTLTPQRDEHQAKVSDRKATASWGEWNGDVRQYQRFGVLRGLAPRRLNGAFLPYVARARRGEYVALGKGFGYEVCAALRNYGGRPGEVELRVRDCPPDGPAAQGKARFSLGCDERREVRLVLPIERFGPRHARLVLRHVASGEVVQDEQVAGDEFLSVIEPFLDRSYYTTEAAAVLVARVNLPLREGSGLELTVSTADGREVARSAARRGEVRMALPLAELALGSHVLTLQLLQASGQALCTSSVTLAKKRPAPGREWKVDRDRCVLLHDGEPFFPFGVVFEAEPEDRHFAFLASLGFNSVIQWMGPRDPESVPGYLRSAARHGLQVMLSPEHLYSAYGDQTKLRDPDGILARVELEQLNASLRASGTGSLLRMKGALLRAPFSRLSVERKTGLFMEYYWNNLPRITAALHHARLAPNVMGHFILDEPLLEVGMGTVGRALYRHIHEQDGYRPVFVNYSSSIPAGREAVDWSDALGTDPYWVPAARGGYRGSINFVSRVVAYTRQRADAVRSVTWTMPMSERWSGCTKRILRPDEQRCQTYLALIHGTRGVFYFKYPFQSRALADCFKQLAAQIRVLEPFCTRPEPVQQISYTPGQLDVATNSFPDVQAAVKRDGSGRLALLVANTAVCPVDAEFRVPWAPRRTAVRRFFADTTRPVQEGCFSERIEPRGVRAYDLGVAEGEPRSAEPLCVAVRMTRHPELVEPEPPAYDREGRLEKRNRIPNPSYEQATVPGWPDYHVRVWGRKDPGNTIGSSDADWFLDRANPFHGTHCLRLVAETAQDRVIAYTSLLIRPQDTARYTFSAHLRADRDGARADLVLGPARPAVSKTVTVTREWTRHSVTLALPPGGHYCRIMVILRDNDRATRMWVDAVQLEEGATPTEFEP